eukprot:scaffold120235_cov48-Phaeocystis_antarctica.AAC.1
MPYHHTLCSVGVDAAAAPAQVARWRRTKRRVRNVDEAASVVEEAAHDGKDEQQVDDRDDRERADEDDVAHEPEARHRVGAEVDDAADRVEEGALLLLRLLGTLRLLLLRARLGHDLDLRLLCEVLGVSRHACALQLHPRRALAGNPATPKLLRLRLLGSLPCTQLHVHRVEHLNVTDVSPAEAWPTWFVLLRR